jgi:hypothetical protein
VLVFLEFFLFLDEEEKGRKARTLKKEFLLYPPGHVTPLSCRWLLFLQLLKKVSIGYNGRVIFKTTTQEGKKKRRVEDDDDKLFACVCLVVVCFFEGVCLVFSRSDTA